MNKIIKYEWMSGFTVARHAERTEEQYLADFEQDLISSDSGRRYLRENQ